MTAHSMPSMIQIVVNGKGHLVPAGCSVAAALQHCGIEALRTTVQERQPRSVFCGMGSCYDCVVTIDGQPAVRTCITEALEGMRIEITASGAAAC